MIALHHHDYILFCIICISIYESLAYISEGVLAKLVPLKKIVALKGENKSLTLGNVGYSEKWLMSLGERVWLKVLLSHWPIVSAITWNRSFLVVICLMAKQGLAHGLPFQIDYIAASWAMLWVFSCSIKGSFMVFKCFYSFLFLQLKTMTDQFLPHFSPLEEETIKEK